ncbi:hypothetical protein ACFQ0T_36540 [Kitasatospora gansuensis]
MDRPTRRPLMARQDVTCANTASELVILLLTRCFTTLSGPRPDSAPMSSSGVGVDDSVALTAMV